MQTLRNLGSLLVVTVLLLSCKKETKSPIQYGSASDIDGNQYKTVQINEDIWMTSSLNVSRFRNGDTIMEAKTDDEWETANYFHTPAWCYYDNDSLNGEKYGKIYNWHAVNDYRGLAPEGWIVPSYDQWTSLVNYLGGSWVAGGKLRSQVGWGPDEEGVNVTGTNETNFSALPGGTRFSGGTFTSKGYLVKYWSSTMENQGEVYHALTSSKNNLLNQFSTSIDNGLYVRCIKYK